MAEIPEHLLKRAQAARENAEANQTTSDQTPSETIEADSAVAVIEEEIPENDERAEEILNQIREGLGETVLTSHIAPGRGLWIRVSSDNWRQTAQFLKDELDCKFFDWLSVIDWMPSPYGRELDTEQDLDPDQDTNEPDQMEWGYTGGDTRFQLICRLYSISNAIGIIVKADLDDQSPRALSLIPVYPGANWHEREAREMFGVTFDEHPDLRNIYLPGDFEGHPLRKDYPLLSRRMKPWPGIVDVEAMPGEDK
jgi:NADH-quinone oxidoreductase subunit C